LKYIRISKGFVQYAILFVLIITISSCHSLSDSELYLESFQSINIDLNDSQETQKWSISLNYYTPEFMTLNELKNDQSIEFKKTLEEYSGVILRHKPSQDFVNSFPFKFNESVGLISPHDTLKSELYHFESDLSGQNIYTFLLAFQPMSQIDRNLVIRNLDGMDVNLSIAQSEINKIPKLSS